MNGIDLDKHRDFSENIAMVRERQHLLTEEEIREFSEIGWITRKALFHPDEIDNENTSDSYRRVLINGYASPGANGRIYPGSMAGRIVSVS